MKVSITDNMSSVCRVCFQEGQDHRVLSCLHSFCASCIDRVISGEAGGEKLKCPVCRSWVRVPDNGAAGLPKDVTQPDDVKELHCETCTLKGESGAPTLWCVTCKVALCSGHVAHHLTSGSGKHLIKALTETGSANYDHDHDSSDRMPRCQEHDSPLEFYCSACDVAVCSRCAVIGVHHGHAGIVEMKVREQRMKKKVQDKVKKLKDDLPCVEATKRRVETVNDDISARAKKARDKVRAAEKRAVDTVHAVAEQKVQDIDDMELFRHKALDKQLDQLKDHAERLKAAVTLTDKLVQTGTIGQDVTGFLQAIDEQANVLAKEKLPDHPVHHSCLDFEPVCEDELIAMAEEMLGNVMPCHATASTSYIEGDDNMPTVRPNEARTFVLHAKNRSGESVQEGADVLHVEWSVIHDHGASRPPAIQVLSKPGGCYEITVAPRTPGEYSVEVFINEEKVPHTLFVQCTEPWFHFDESECQPGLVISQDKLTVTKCGDHMFPSVLGSSGRAHGKHAWKVQISQKAGHIAIGVADKPGLTAANKNWKQAYVWSTLGGGESYILGKKSREVSQVAWLVMW